MRGHELWGCVGLVMVAFFGVAALGQGAFVNFESSQVHPVDLSPDGSTLAVCNTADDTLELFDVTGGVPIPIGSVPVGIDPVSVRFRTTGEVWVVNHISDSVSVVDVVAQHVFGTLTTLDEPADVVFAGAPTMAFVSCSQANTIQRFDPGNFAAPPTSIAIEAEDPRALAVSPDGMTVYAAIFESGNGSTLIAGGNDGTLGGFPTNAAMEDAGNPYGGVNPPPNDPTDSNMDSNFWIPAKAANGTPPPVGLIVKKDSGGAWRDDNGEDWTPWITGASAGLSGRYTGWDLIDRDVAIVTALNAPTPAVAYAEELMNVCMALAVNPASGDITVVGTDGINEVRFEPNVNGRFLRVNIGIVDDASPTTTSVVDLNAEHLALAQPGGVDPYETPAVPQVDRDKSIGDPRGIVWNSAGTRGYITGMGSNNLVVVDANGDRVVTGATTELRPGPTGLVLSQDETRLYVLNRFDASVSVLDTTTLLETANVPFHDSTPMAIRTGRKHLYDTHKNSGLGHVACASCHVDGRMDRLAWDLGDPSGAIKPLSGTGNPPQHNLGANIPGLLEGGTSPAFEDFHPMKGPMTTQTLIDIIGKEPFHWRGDRDGLEEFNDAFMTLQGDDQILTPQEMQEFEDFLATTHFPPNPFRNFDNTLPTNLPLPGQFSNGRFFGSGGLAEGAALPNGDAVRGLEIYRDQGNKLDSGNFTCVICHTLPTGAGTDSRFDGVSAFDPIPPGPMGERHLALVSVDGSTNRAIKTPQLRNQYDKAGFELTPGNPSLAGFGLLHDGSIDSISRFVSEPVFEVTSDQDVADLTALIMAFSGGFDFAPPNPGPDPEAPGPPSQDVPAAVGKQDTIDSAAKDVSLINAMIALADAGDVDVIAKSLIAGDPRGWVYTGSGQFTGDRADEPAYPTASLVALAAPGNEVTFTVEPAGSGQRTGIDRDRDNLLNYDETRDLDPVTPGVQNPFDPASADSTGDNGQNTPDGIPDNFNDYDGDGFSNAAEFFAGTNPADENDLPGVPTQSRWGLILLVAMMIAGSTRVAVRSRTKQTD